MSDKIFAPRSVGSLIGSFGSQAPPLKTRFSMSFRETRTTKSPT
jgi:hypothetical protein